MGSGLAITVSSIYITASNTLLCPAIYYMWSKILCPHLVLIYLSCSSTCCGCIMFLDSPLFYFFCDHGSLEVVCFITSSVTEWKVRYKKNLKYVSKICDADDINIQNFIAEEGMIITFFCIFYMAVQIYIPIWQTGGKLFAYFAYYGI